MAENNPRPIVRNDKGQFLKGAAGNRFIDLTGQTFYWLTVKSFSHRNRKQNGASIWNCDCICGTLVKVLASKLLSGWTRSCGCLRDKKIGDLNRTHGMTRTPTYRSWLNMINRCSNPKNNRFHLYGGRGITVCDQWNPDKGGNFENFVADMGERPSLQHSIERRNNNLGYFPANCYWATAKQQANNHRNNRRLTFQGETLTMQQWVEKLGINQGTLSSRLNRHHWSVEKALSTPVRKKLL